MQRILVTGAAGFIGQALVDRLAGLGHEVVGADRRAPSPTASDRPVRHVQIDLSGGDPGEVRDLCDGVDVVFHLAGRPGVQSSWGDGFHAHLQANLAAGQRLLEAALDRRVPRIVIASSSSVYGTTERPAGEGDPVRPVSPYGVTKAALEQLATVYAARGLSTVVLRYFTVYGPHQRPDMAFHRMVAAGLGGRPFPLRGDGRQRRDFTFVDDAVDATVAAGRSDAAAGTVINVGSGRPVALTHALQLVESLLGRPVPVVRQPRPPGDPDCTMALVDRAAALLGWEPTTPLREGLSRQIDAARLFVRAVGSRRTGPVGVERRRPQPSVA